MNDAALTKLAKLCGMFGSDHDGEVINAARAAHKLLLQNGYSWEDFFARDTQPQQYEPKTGLSEHQHFGRVMLADAGEDLFSEWELGFLESVSYRSSLSFKQQTVFDRLWRKFCEAGYA